MWCGFASRPAQPGHRVPRGGGMHRSRRLLTTGFAVALLVVTACESSARSGPDNEQAAPLSHTDIVSEAMDPGARPPAERIRGARDGGTLTVYMKAMPTTFDPTAVNYTESAAIMTLVTRSLTQYRKDGETGDMVLVPDMATDLGRPNADFTEWTFTLRDGLRYEDGREVTSEDVAHAVRRQFARGQIPGGPTYGIDYFRDGDTYRGPYEDGPEFAGVETPDDQTIVFHLRKPFADLRYYAAMPNFGALPADDDTVDYSDGPPATGPYRFAEYEPGAKLVLERNPEWDPATDTTRQSYIDRFVFAFGTDAGEAQERLVADRGSDQHALSVDPVLATTYAQIRDTDGEQRILKGRGSCTDMAFLDTRWVPLEVRRALQIAWPISAEARAAGRIPGLTWSPGTSMMPSITPGWVPHDPVGNHGEGNGDPERARALLAQTENDGFTLRLPYVSGEPLQAEVADVRKDGLEAAGFDVDLVPVPRGEMRSFLGDPDSDIDVRFFGWCTDWPSGGSVFPALVDGRKISDNSVLANPSLLDERDIIEEIDRISGLPPAEGLRAWGDLDQLIMEEHAPVVIRGEVDVAMLHGSKVGNAIVDEVNNMPYYVGMHLIP